MSRATGSVLVLIFGLIIVLAGCGNGGLRVRTAEPPTGSFSNASLTGSYAFALAGTNTSGFFTTAGSFSADGAGHITGGVQDVNAGAGVFTELPISGAYSVTADGRGTAILNSSVAVMTLDFVLVSAQHGLIARFDSSATASGTLDRQDATAFTTAALRGPFAFNVSGVNSSGAGTQSAGTFTTDGTGNITAGIEDDNDGGQILPNMAVQGSYTVATNGRGTLAITTSAGTLNFAFHVVDANHLKLVETDTLPAMGGDAHRQPGTLSNASLAGAFAFTLGGSSASGPFASGGIFTADGTGHIASGIADINDNGTPSTNLALTGTYSIASTGRGTMTLTTSKGASNFVVYPSTGGLQMLQVDSATTASGTAFAQTGALSTASINGTYGLNLTAASNNGPSDTIAQFTADGAGVVTKGALDTNLMGSLAQNLAVGGGYNVSANGRGTWVLRTSFGTQNLVLYVVDSTHVLFLETDSTIGLGSFERQ